MQSNRFRISWVDQLKGFGIILVIYGHNFPVIESYIYSFHMPLFFFLGGFFHPKEINFEIVKKRAKQILLPYLIWSGLLFLFWFFVGRKFGDSVHLNLSPVKNFIGIFYAQGGHDYMNWGVPMWFLPAFFFTFLIFGLVRILQQRIQQIMCLFVLILIGFLIPRIYDSHIIWSIDVSLVALFFYGFGFYLKKIWLEKKYKFEVLLLVILFVLHLFCSLFLIEKIDMYRSTYGHEFFFILNASVAIMFWGLSFKKIKKITPLIFFGKNTIPILALHIRTLTIIKLVLLIIWGAKTFQFSEIEKIVLVLFQLTILYPIIIFINKYLPVLNGKRKTLETRS